MERGVEEQRGRGVRSVGGEGAYVKWAYLGWEGLWINHVVV